MTFINPPPQLNYSVSVIIPMYNVEKYIAETLDSLLNQTLQDFEVIIVNDCSPDNSRAIAESYVEKFDGRLKLFDNEQNSGPSATRNNGLRHATGEYIFFMDSDDLIVAYALEELYNYAKQFDVDFINCSANYELLEDGKELVFKRWIVKAVHAITLETNKNRIVDLVIRRKTTWAPWRKFCRRNFLLENEIFFLENFSFHEDKFWSYAIFLCAEKILQLPKPYIFYRENKESISRSERADIENIVVSLKPLICGIKWIDNVMSRQDYFKQNPQKRFAVLESIVGTLFDVSLEYRVELESHEIYDAIKAEFGDAWGDNDVLIAQLITYVDTLKRKSAEMSGQLKISRQRIAELERQINQQ